MASDGRSDFPPAAGGVGGSFGSLRFWLRFADHDVELQRGETAVGRSAECQLVLDDPLVSRRHARFLLDGDTVVLEDLGSVNGVSVNGERLRGARQLASGDRVTVGDQTFQLYAAHPRTARPTKGARRAVAQTVSAARPDLLDAVVGQTVRPPTPFEQDLARLDTLLQMADKSLSLGRGADAERLLQEPLKKLVDDVGAGAKLSDEWASRVARIAVKLAESTRKATWVDYAIALYARLGRPLPGDTVEKLYTSLRTLPPISLGAFRAYLARLKQSESALSPAERFVVRRLAGLEPFAASR